MTNPNDPKNPKNIGDAAKRRVDDVTGGADKRPDFNTDKVRDAAGSHKIGSDKLGDGHVTDRVTERVEHPRQADHVTHERTETSKPVARTHEGSTAVREDNSGGGWWKWLLGLLALLLLAWLLWSLIGGDKGGDTTTSSTTETVATTTENVATETATPGQGAESAPATN